MMNMKILEFEKKYVSEMFFLSLIIKSYLVRYIIIIINFNKI